MAIVAYVRDVRRCVATRLAIGFDDRQGSPDIRKSKEIKDQSNLLTPRMGNRSSGDILVKLKHPRCTKSTNQPVKSMGNSSPANRHARSPIVAPAMAAMTRPFQSGNAGGSGRPCLHHLVVMYVVRQSSTGRWDIKEHQLGISQRVRSTSIVSFPSSVHCAECLAPRAGASRLGE